VLSGHNENVAELLLIDIARRIQIKCTEDTPHNFVPLRRSTMFWTARKIVGGQRQQSMS